MDQNAMQQAQSFDAAMEKQLAEFCQRLMQSTGKVKKEAIEWCCDRFQKGGKYNRTTWATGRIGRFESTGAVQELIVEPGHVFAIDHDMLVLAMLSMKELRYPDKDMSIVKTILKLCMDHNAFMLWRMCNMHLDVYGVMHDDDDLQPSMYGMFVNLKSTNEECGTEILEETRGRAMIVPCSLVKDLLDSQAMRVIGEAR